MKRKFSVRLTAAVASALALSLCAVCVMSSAVYLGDVNNDNKVNSGDSRIVLRHTARIAPITDEKALKLADVTGDGKINSQDARTILRVAARLEQKVEYTEPEEPTDPKPTDPKPTEPKPTEPKPTEPKPTEPPTTEAPTTEAPTTEAPTTEAPTTEAPTTEAPTTEAPTTEAPTTEAPTTEAPTTEPSTTEPPTTEPPTTEPPTTEPPTTEPPTTEPPTTEPPVTEPTTNPNTDSYECYDYYMKSVVKTYDAQGKETVNNVEFAVDRHEQKVGKQTVAYYDYFARVPGMVGNKDVGMLVKEEVNKISGKVSQDYYLINYTDSEYLCLDSSVVDSVMDTGEPLIPEISPITIYKSLDGLDVTQVVEDGELYYVFTEKNTGVAGQVAEYYLVKAASGDYYYAAKTRLLTNGKLTNQTQVLSLSLDPSAYVGKPAMKGIDVNAANMIFKLQDMMDFMDKLGMTM